LLFLGKTNYRGRKLSAFNFFIKLSSAIKLQKLDPISIFTIAFMNLTPLFFVRNIWFGNVSKSIPFPLHEEKKFRFSVMFFFKLLRRKYRAVKIDNLVDLLIASAYKRGLAYEQKVDMYKKVTVNKHLLGLLK
jgi:ribosomal protein S7